MSSELVLDATARRRSPAACPARAPTKEQGAGVSGRLIVAVMRQAPASKHGLRLGRWYVGVGERW